MKPKPKKLKRLTFKHFKEIYSRVPRMCVDVIVETPRGIVLTLRDIEPWKGQWHIPGGTVMYTESIEHAVKRVAKEEIGVNVEIRKLVGYTEYLSERKLRGWGHSICFEFLVRIKSGKLKGSKQGEKFGIFKTAPANTIAEQKRFLRKMKFLR